MGSLYRIGNIAGKYLSVIAKQTNYLRCSQNLLFHVSSLLNVKGQEIKMPSLSPTMSEGTIVKWLKKEGETVAAGDVLCDIQTDKAVVSLEADEEGVLAKILIQEDTKDVKVGTLIALMVQEGEDWKSVEIPESSSSASTQDTPAAAASDPAETEPTSDFNGIVLRMPSLSPTMSEGTIVKWLKNEGDPIVPGDVLCDIQTDKAVMSMETEEEGILAKILLPDDTKDVKIGTMIALIVPEGEDWKNVVVPKQGAAPKPSSTQSPSASTSPTATISAHKSEGSLYGPAVRSLLEIYQIDGSSIKATGRKNKLLKSDVLQHIAANNLLRKPPLPVPPPSAGSSPSGPSAPSAPKSKTQPSKPKATPGSKYIDIEISNIRKVIAKRLTQSKQEIPHTYGSVEINLNRVMAMRQVLAKNGIKVSLNDIMIRAAAASLEACPEVNSIYGKEGPQLLKEIDISVAVATENGLITPIVKGANKLSYADISKTVRELAGKARDGKLKPEEFQGGSFTISNLGMFGITEFSAIINPPQVAILAVGGGITRLNTDLIPKTTLRATLCFDRRALTEAEGSRFLSSLKEFLEEPQLILTGAKVQSLDDLQSTL